MRHHHLRRNLALALRKALKAHTASRRALVAERLHMILRPAVRWGALSSSRVPFGGDCAHKRAVLEHNTASCARCGYRPLFGGMGRLAESPRWGEMVR